MSELQRAAEQAELEWQRKREEKSRNAIRYAKWLQRKRMANIYEADMVQNAGR